MIHYWECERCTNQWQTSCFGDMGLSPEEKKRRHRQLWSNLCWDCFEQLEAEKILGLELFELYFYLREKSENYGASKTWRVFNKGTTKAPFYNHQKFSGMCHDYISATYDANGSEKTPSNFESGTTAEHEQLREIVSNVQDVYRAVIKAQRTPKRIELDEFQEKSEFVTVFGPQPRPEGFKGDPAGKPHPEFLFGIDPAGLQFRKARVN